MNVQKTRVPGRQNEGSQEQLPTSANVPDSSVKNTTSRAHPRINVRSETPIMSVDRTAFEPRDSVADVWRRLQLPESALKSLTLTGDGLGLPSSFKVGHIAQASIALSALTAALVYASRNQNDVPEVSVCLQDAVTEFRSERYWTLDGQRPKADRIAIGGLHKTSDGHIRMHDCFLNHREGAKRLLGCEGEDDRDAIAEKISQWPSLELETAAARAGLAMAALRSVEQWDATSQSKAVQNFPIIVRKLCDGPRGMSDAMSKSTSDKCLRGLKVVELTRVIAAPVAGKTLAAHGADVLWVTSPHLPDLPGLDRDVARGKRTIQLDLNTEHDRSTLQRLAEDADVFIQSYRPGSLASKGFSTDSLIAKSKRAIIIANLSAYGTEGPWGDRRGFDSLVQTCSGLNASEADHYGAGEPARVLPCQALDHASGYFLAAGISAALYRQAQEGGSYEVNVGLAGTMKYLRSLGQYEGNSGFACEDFDIGKVPADLFEERNCGFGQLRAIRHSAKIEGVSVGFDIMPQPLGSDRAEWL